MCGIAGYVSDTALAPEVLAAMTRSLAHRGPDADGFWTSGRAHLGHRRLSVIDIAGSPQPMIEPDGRVAVVFNGEIYNFRELRDELARGGWTFRTAGDTETLAGRLGAMGRGRRHALARDVRLRAVGRATRRRCSRRATIWASSPSTTRGTARRSCSARSSKAVLAHPAVARGDRPRRAAPLSRMPVHSGAALDVPQRAQAAARAHADAARNGARAARRSGARDYADKLALSERDAADALDRELRASVEGMLVADVPLGAFVSGGIDSGLIAAIMTDLTGGPIDTFNIGFEGDVAVSEHREAARGRARTSAAAITR